MQITELLPELITKLAPTGPFPTDVSAQFAYWRQLVTKRQPGDLPKHYLQQEDQLLDLIWQKRGYVELNDLTEYRPGIYLTRGDLTRLKVDAIVNSASDQMLGCFEPEHICLDNEIHVLAGSRLREECALVMQHTRLTPGQARITAGHHLPSQHIIHALAPKVMGEPTLQLQQQLAACYEATLTLALENNLQSIAFCSLGTGHKNFPNPLATQIALDVTERFHAKHPEVKIIFCPYKDIDYNLYHYLLNN